MATSAKLTRRLEDYLEAVWELVRRDGVARVRDIAARTKVSKSSVTAALKQLAQADLVHYDPYQLVTLTRRGKAAAKTIRGKHDALRRFLVDVLDVDPATADANACRMEHVVDNQVLRRLKMLVEFIQESSPHGEDRLDRFSAYCRQRESRGEDRSNAG